MDQVEERSLKLGKYVRNMRQTLGISVPRLAHQVGVANSTIHRLEHGTLGQPRLELLQRLALALDVEINDLLILMGYPTLSNTPPVAIYLRTKLRHLGPEAIEMAETYIAHLERTFGTDGPSHGEDELPENPWRVN